MDYFWIPDLPYAERPSIFQRFLRARRGATYRTNVLKETTRWYHNALSATMIVI